MSSTLLAALLLIAGITSAHADVVIDADDGDSMIVHSSGVKSYMADHTFVVEAMVSMGSKKTALFNIKVIGCNGGRKYLMFVDHNRELIINEWSRNGPLVLDKMAIVTCKLVGK